MRFPYWRPACSTGGAVFHQCFVNLSLGITNPCVWIDCCCGDVNVAGEGEGQQDEDMASGTAVMMSAFATAGGGVGVAYVNTAFRNLGLMEFELADLEGVVVQVGVEFS